MRLKTLQSSVPRHSDAVSAVGWSSSDEMVSCSDDHSFLKWNLVTMEATQVATLPETLFPTSMSWFPRSLTKGGNDVLALTSSDGKLHIIARSGKIEKSVDAHRGAALSARWSHDGTGLITCGEDGAVKMWSRAAMLRSVLAQMATPVYAACWDGSAARVLYSCHDSCYIKSLKTQVSPIKWKAHDGLVTCVDWSGTTDLIISGGEDGKFKVWDSFGRVLFTSASHETPMTSLAFSPDGSLFVVGSFNLLRLCDKAGWSHSVERLDCGSVMAVGWSPDGTQLVAGGSLGHVVHAHLVEKRISYRNWDITQAKTNLIEVRDMASEVAREKLDTRDRITKFSMNHDHLVVVTSKQIYIYISTSWNTPVLVDLKEGSVTLLIQTENYEGRYICEIKVPGTGGNLNEANVALSNDTIAVRDKNDFAKLHFFDPNTSKVQGDGALTHSAEICCIGLSQCGSLSQRVVAFTDVSASVYVSLVNSFGANPRTAKIGTLVEQICFNDLSSMLVGLGEGKVSVWPMPSLAFVDRDLLQRAVVEKTVNGLGKFPHLVNFTKNQVVLRRSDGSLVPIALSPFAGTLLAHADASKWDEAIRLCRHIGDDVLWAILAGSAAQQKNLYAAEIAYGALEEGEKVAFLSEARNHPNKDVRAAMLVLLTGKISDADAMLERTGNPFRAIMLNISTFRWSRALDLAIKHKMHVDTVLGYRQQYLDEFGKRETDQKFLEQLSKYEIDWEHIQEQIAAEKEKDH
ncbi:unnamed protein product, partial [Mesorhabditis spiculigera]